MDSNFCMDEISKALDFGKRKSISFTLSREKISEWENLRGTAHCAFKDENGVLFPLLRDFVIKGCR